MMRDLMIDKRICLVSTVKNEGPFILEWIAHNMNIGITNFIVFSNHCDDGSDAILDRLDELGIIRHVPNPEVVFGTRNFHRVALAYAPLLKEYRKAEYIFVSDVDEFVWLAPEVPTLQHLLAATGDPDAISFTEIGFGFGGIFEYEDRPVTEQFLYRGTKTPGKWKSRRGVKTLARQGAPFAEHTNHRPRLSQDASNFTWLNGSGEPVADEFARGQDRGFDSRRTFKLACLHHYQVRSAESMLVKFERGDAVRPGRMAIRYVEKRGGGDVEDRSMLAVQPALAARIDELKKDDQLAMLHERSMGRYRQKIRSLKNHRKFSSIYDDILTVARKGEGDNSDKHLSQ